MSIRAPLEERRRKREASIWVGIASLLLIGIMIGACMALAIYR